MTVKTSGYEKSRVSVYQTSKTEKYDQWLTEEGINLLTSAGTLKPLPHHTIATWFMEAWEEIGPETIRKSFKSCALNLATDGTTSFIVLRKVSLAKPEKKFYK